MLVAFNVACDGTTPGPVTARLVVGETASVDSSVNEPSVVVLVVAVPMATVSPLAPAIAHALISVGSASTHTRPLTRDADVPVPPPPLPGPLGVSMGYPGSSGDVQLVINSRRMA